MCAADEELAARKGVRRAQVQDEDGGGVMVAEAEDGVTDGEVHDVMGLGKARREELGGGRALRLRVEGARHGRGWPRGEGHGEVE